MICLAFTILSTTVCHNCAFTISINYMYVYTTVYIDAKANVLLLELYEVKNAMTKSFILHSMKWNK